MAQLEIGDGTAPDHEGDRHTRADGSGEPPLLSASRRVEAPSTPLDPRPSGVPTRLPRARVEIEAYRVRTTALSTKPALGLAPERGTTARGAEGRHS